MAFPVTLNGRTYTLADFAGTNYVEGLPDAFEDFVTQAGSLYSTTSTTSNTIGTGSKTFTVEASKPYQVGTPLRIADTAAPSTNWIDGIVTAYSGTTLTVNAVAYAGSGTKTAWSINIGGGPIAYTGTLPVAQGGTGATTAADARTNLDTYSKAEADSRFLNVSGEASDVTMTGNVTIGDAAGDTLTVNATADFNTGINVDGTITSDGLTVGGSASIVGTVANFYLEDSDDPNNAYTRFYSYSGVGIIDVDPNNNGGTASSFRVAVDGSERMRIDSSGNVGIGTSSPSTKLHVAGDTTFGGAIDETVFALSGTSPALDPSNGTIQTHTLSGNTTYSDSLSAGESITLMIDDGTAYTVTWPSVTWKTDGGSAPTLNTSGDTVIVLWKVGTTIYGARVGDA